MFKFKQWRTQKFYTGGSKQRKTRKMRNTKKITRKKRNNTPRIRTQNQKVFNPTAKPLELILY